MGFLMLNPTIKHYSLRKDLSLIYIYPHKNLHFMTSGNNKPGILAEKQSSNIDLRNIIRLDSAIVCQ